MTKMRHIRFIALVLITGSVGSAPCLAEPNSEQVHEHQKLHTGLVSEFGIASAIISAWGPGSELLSHLFSLDPSECRRYPTLHQSPFAPLVIHRLHAPRPCGSVWRTLDRGHWHVVWDRSLVTEARRTAARSCNQKHGRCVEDLTFRYCAAPASGTNTSGQRKYFWAQAVDAVTAGRQAVEQCRSFGLERCQVYSKSFCNSS